MATATIFKQFTIPVENKSLLLIGNEIISGKYKTEVEEIRTLIQQGKTEEANNKKMQLLAFTPSATFSEKRQMLFLKSYSGFVHLDFDKLIPEQLQNAFEIIAQIPFTFLCFKSPSGNGLKVFVEVDSAVEDHETAYAQVQHYYEEATGLKADPKCKDVTRLCFVSYDDKAFKNIQNQKFKVTIQEQTKSNLNTQENIRSEESQDYEQLFQQQIQFTDKKETYQNGNRNNYIYLLASNCNRVGIPQSDTQILCAKHFDLSEREIKTAVNSAYTHHKQEHNQFKQEEKLELDEEKMPTLPDEIFNSIPDFLKKIVKVANNKEERDILFLGSLVTLSVAFPKLIGKYADNPVNANLFIFISAKASAGKGVLIHCRKLVEPIHNALRQQAKLMKQQYDTDMQIYNAAKGNTSAEKPQKPPQKMLFIPANNSSTGFFELLNDSDGRGLIFETEADTLSKSFKSEHGNFSDGLRNAFQHEPHSYYRRTDKELVEIQRPCLSVMLSGTPKQIQTLIPSAENGLASRFMFYIMNMIPNWKDVFDSKTENGLDNHFHFLGHQFFVLYKTLHESPEKYFMLSYLQQKQFNQFFEKIQTQYLTIQEDDILSMVRRLGLIAFRIMMIKSALRIMEHGDTSETMMCNDEDFNNTLKIITVLIQHSNLILTQILEVNNGPKPKHKKQLFLEQLPANFTYQQYITIAQSLNINPKTAEKYIKNFIDAELIQHPSKNNFINPNPKHP
jgi:hypothetical protein